MAYGAAVMDKRDFDGRLIELMIPAGYKPPSAVFPVVADVSYSAPCLCGGRIRNCPGRFTIFPDGPDSALDAPDFPCEFLLITSPSNKPPAEPRGFPL